MPHLIVLHSGNNEFYINAEHISAIFPAMVKRDQKELHGSKLILATHASRFIVEESPARIIELVNQSNKGHGFRQGDPDKNARASHEGYNNPFI